jgi:hypothetical protein
MPSVGYTQTAEHKLNAGIAISLGWAKRKGIKSEAQIKYWDSLKGKNPSNIEELKGRAKTRVGKKHFAWKGDSVSYRNLHRWVRYWKGEPIKCEFCGKEKTTAKSIQWANKSHNYNRILTDWISLCVKCHKKYDGYTGEDQPLI